MEQHSVIGERILRNVDDYAEIAAIVRHHHERVDGNGYPDRLEGDDIPVLARIIAVADAYNAMTSDGRIAMRCRVGSPASDSLRPSRASSTRPLLRRSRRFSRPRTEEYRMGRGPGFALRVDGLKVAETWEIEGDDDLPLVQSVRQCSLADRIRPRGDRLSATVHSELFEDVPDVDLRR